MHSQESTVDVSPSSLNTNRVPLSKALNLHLLQQSNMELEFTVRYCSVNASQQKGSNVD